LRLPVTHWGCVCVLLLLLESAWGQQREHDPFHP